MARQFSDARALLSHLLDRREDGVADPIAYPDFSSPDSVAAIDAFMRQLEDAEAAGAIRIVKGRGRDSDRIASIRLGDPARLYALLDRRPVAEQAAEAERRLLDGIDLPEDLREPVGLIRAQWQRGRPWQTFGFTPDEVDRLRSVILLAKAILENRHHGLDYRTFSRRFAGDSKALERLEAAVVRLLGTVLELPPGARPRDALRTLGLEKFAPPLLLSGRVDFASCALSQDGPAYFGIPPTEAGRLRWATPPRYILTVENYASFHRHISEADRERQGLTIYVGGYPSLATQEALRTLAQAMPEHVPLLHWSDIDPDGSWIFCTIEQAIARPLRPHLMSPELAEAHGRRPADPTRLRQPAPSSAIARLVAYLSGPDAKWLEQEELDPVLPEIEAASM